MPSEEQRLWFAVLTQALKDFIGGRGTVQTCGPADYRADYREAEFWLFDDSYAVGSFSWVANLFALDPDAVRGRLQKENCSTGHLRHEYRRGPTSPLALNDRRKSHRHQATR
jgi:hypothetical protein